MTDDVTNAVVDDIADVTPAWLSRILGVDISWVEARPIGTGQTGVSYRVEHNAGSLVVKLAAGPPETRALVAQGYAWEIGFYQHIAARVRVRAPKAVHAAISPDHTCFTLLLEDLSAGVPGRQTEGCTPAQARAALENLAGLHAPLWNDPVLQGGMDWLQPLEGEFLDLLTTLSKDASTTFVERYRDALDPADAETVLAAAQLTEHWARHYQTPFSVVHGDYRLDNLMFFPDGGVAALDWQTLMVGHPLRDVAYFLSMSLPTEVRRAHEEELVTAYHRALAVPGYSFEDCWAGYRTGMLQGPLITVLGSVYSPSTADAAADAMFVSMATRAARAIRDLGTLEAVSR
jgi:Ser/Thr protein kinase RdoA (MazF antagonist)